MTKAERRAFDAGFVSGQIKERAKVAAELRELVAGRRIARAADFPRPKSVREAERPHLHIVAIDEPAAKVFDLSTKKTAS